MADLGAIGKNVSDWKPGPVPAWVFWDYTAHRFRAVPDEWPDHGVGGAVGGGISIF